MTWLRDTIEELLYRLFFKILNLENYDAESNQGDSEAPPPVADQSREGRTAKRD